jgi:predicted TIM-barrel fold metal-dependent hydrolase
MTKIIDADGHISLNPAHSGRTTSNPGFEPDDLVLKAATALGVEEYLMWASDYPHYDCQFPGAVEELREHCAALPEDSRHKIMGANAAHCYGLS